MVSLMKISLHQAIMSKVSENNYVCKGLSVSFLKDVKFITYY